MQNELEAKNTQLEIKNREIKIANHLKSEFLINISHELRTPLNSIIGFTELMHNGKTGPIANNQKEYLGYVLTSSRHLLRLINDILDLSKVESGKFEFFPEPVVLSSIVNEVCDILHASIGDKQINLTVHVDPAVDNITIDSAKLKQVLYNFVSNAIKFTLDNGQVSITALPEGNEHFRLEIQDTGIGIRAEDISKLFVGFQQLDAGIAKKYQGSGLGLALNRRIVEAQGGKVGVDSELGKGSTFYAILPRKPIF
jgi:signal transduction histidine kinase